MELLQQGKKPSKDVVSSHKISLLVMIKEVCCAKNSLRMKDATALSSVPWFDNSKQKREFAVSTLELIQGPNLELQQFLSEIKRVMSSSLYNAVISRLRETSTGGISGLMDLIQSLDVLLVDPNHPVSVVNKSSVIGLFVRHMMLAFDKLSFGQMIKLYHNYQSYCNIINIDDHSDDYSEVDTTIIEDAVPTSRRQAELFVARQVTRLQTNEKAALSPSELQKKLRYLLTAAPNLAEAHFLSLMNCLRLREYCGSIHSLHRAFDCISSDDNKGEESLRNFRYAALNLGSLLCRFGFREQASLALHEAMTIARETSDSVCLQHALVWLYRLESERKDVLVERSIVKTGELAMPYLASIGILTFSQLKAKTPAMPAQVFEFIRKSDILNCQHSILELTTQSYTHKASLWNIYGKKEMVTLTIHLLVYLNTSEPFCKGLYHSGEALCRAFCQLATLFSKEGKYERMKEALLIAKEEFPLHSTYSNIWMFTELLLSYEKSLLQGDWQEAESMCTKLAAFDAPECKIRKAEFLLFKGELSQSAQLLDDILASSDKNDQEYKVRCLTLVGRCYCHANKPSMALFPLSNALAIAEQYHLKYLSAWCIMHLANTQYLMDYPNKALKLIDTIKIDLLAHGYPFDHGLIQLLNAKCLVKKAEELSSHSEQCKNVLTEAAFEFVNATESFLKIEALFFAKECLYRQACLFNELGLIEERNRAAYQFRHLDQYGGCDFLPLNEVF